MENVLPYVAFLACPIGMGLMMWFMSRGMSTQRRDATPPESIERLRAEQARLAAEIDRLERTDAAAGPDHYVKAG